MKDAIQQELFPKRAETSFETFCKELGVVPSGPGWPDRFGASVSRFFQETGVPRVRTLSLFSGAGGLDIGFSDAGFEIIESVEIEKAFCETLKSNAGPGKRHPSTTVSCIDIRKFSGNHLGRVDFIIGGPPCQTFSAAGRRANGVLGTTDARGVLFREYVRLLQELTPKGFLFENVYGIVGAQGGMAWKEICRSFAEIGYTLFFRILDAADYGAPQHRERLLIVGLKNGAFLFPRPTHGPDSPNQLPFYSAGEAIQGLTLSESERKPGLGGRFGKLLDAIPPGLNYSFYTEELGHPNPVFAWRSKFSDFLYKADPEMPVRTIKASGGAYTGPLHWENRFFAIAEYKRLQTFPDDYKIFGGKQVAVKQIGNSVPPQFARIMALAIQSQVFGVRLPWEMPLLEKEEVLSFRKNKRQLTQYFREKARIAISSMGKPPQASTADISYDCSLSDDFRFLKNPGSGAQFHVSAAKDPWLLFRVTDSETSQNREYVSVEIRPSSGEWSIESEKVLLSICSAKPLAFTVAWKAFDLYLAEHAIKADLVQLNGYYQYESSLRCSLENAPASRFYKILESILAGHRVAEILPTSELAKAWNIPQGQVVREAERLRKIGYEVRNHKTNPQIPEGSWLLPYSFPTLTHQSVQLRKSVR